MASAGSFDYTQLGGFPVMATADGFTMTEERYQELRKLPWPEPNEETIVTSREIVEPELIKAQRTKGTRIATDEEDSIEVVT